MRIERDLPTETATAELGRELAARLKPGTVVALIGELGAGKTTLVRAIAEGLGANPQMVSSPTFALIHEYAGRMPIFHFDVYRLPNVAAFLELGVDEYYQAGGVCLIEWADRVASALPKQHVRVELTHGPTGRHVVITGLDPIVT